MKVALSSSMVFRLFVVGVFLWPILPRASIHYDLDDDLLLADVNGMPVSVESVRLMHRVANKSNREISLPDMLNELVDKEVMATYARQQYDSKTLYSQGRVGFLPQVIIENQFVAVLRRAYDVELTKFLQASKKGGLETFIVQPFSQNKKTLEQDFRFTHELSYTLNEAQQKKAQGIELIRYQFSEGETQAITLWDIYRRQNVQGKIQLHNYDITALQEKVQNRLGSLFVLWWAEHHSGLKKRDIDTVHRFIENAYLFKQLLQLTGARVDLHSDNSELQRLKKTVTPAEIETYYHKNKDKFKIVEKVKARHIRTRTKEDAEKARAELDAGRAFSDVVETYSIAEDAREKGNLGWILRKEGRSDWLKSLALMQHEGEPTRPVRTPQLGNQSTDWEIVLVDRRVEGFLPLEGESVRYQAINDISRMKALENYKAIQQQVKATANVRFNRRLKQ